MNECTHEKFFPHMCDIRYVRVCSSIVLHAIIPHAPNAITDTCIQKLQLALNCSNKRAIRAIVPSFVACST